MDFTELVKLISAIAAISGIITAGAIYYSRKSVDRAVEFSKEQNKHIDTKTSSAISDLKESFTQSTQNTREDFGKLVTHIDERIDRIYNRMETNTHELKEYVSHEVSSLKAKDYDQDIKIEHTKDKLHGISEELLKFRLEASEKYERKRQMTDQVHYDDDSSSK